MPVTLEEIARGAFAAVPAPTAVLLTRYAEQRDHEAFADLVRQFGPLVLGVCRRTLGPSADADDAFQDVFLALARRAGSFRDARALPAWLHRVAVRVARKARAQRSHTSVPVPDPVDPADPFAEVMWRDARRALDEELDALPDEQRGPVILCWLDGLTRDEAAERLGVPLGTLKRRLAAGRDALRARLTRRGLATGLVAAVVLAPDGLRADVPRALAAAVAATVRHVRPRAPASFWAVLVAVAAAAAGGLALVAAGSDRPEVALPPRPALARPVDVPAEPLPAGAVTRFGGLNFRVPNGIGAAALSPDGTRLAVADGEIVRVYEAATWRLLHALRADGGRGSWSVDRTLAFSHDGRRLAYTKNGQFAFAWELATGKRTHRFDSGDSWGWKSFCAFTPDGLLALSDKEKLRFFDPVTGAEKRAVAAPHTIALSPDGKHYVRYTGRVEPVSLVLGDATTGTDRHTFAAVVGWTPGVSFTPDSKRLTLVPMNGTEVEVWDVAERALVKRLPAPPGPRPSTGQRPGDRNGYDAGFTPDGREVWLALPNYDLVRWDAATFRELPRLVAGPVIAPRGILPLPDGRTVLVPCSMGWVRVFDRQTGRERAVPDRYASDTAFAVSPDDAFVAVGDATGRIDLRDPVTGKLVRTVRETGDPVRKLVFGPDGLALGACDGFGGGHTDERRGAVRAFWALDGKQLWSQTLDAAKEKDVWSLCPLGFTTEDRIVVSRYPQGGCVYDVRTGKEGAKLALKSTAAALDPDGRRLATDEHGEIVIVDVATGRETKRVEVDPEEKVAKRLVGSALFAWSADGRTLVTTLPKDHVCLIDPAAGTVRTRLAVAPPDDGTDKEAAQLKEMLWRLDRHSIRALTVAPDGQRVLAAALNGWHVALWDARTGKQLAKLDSGFQVDGAAFSSDGKSAFTFGGTGLGYRWDVEKLIAAQKPKK